LRDQVQLVLTDRSPLTGDRDYGVFSARTWRLADLGAKHAMLRAGLGWGGMPEHLVAEDIAAGRLKRLHIPPEEGAAGEGGALGDEGAPPGEESVVLPLCVAYRRAQPPGPAGRWLFRHVRERLKPKAENSENAL
jgi:DNA-binding transcriptional LysR family regulator